MEILCITKRLVNTGSTKSQRGVISTCCASTTSTPALEKSTAHMEKAKEKTKINPVQVEDFHTKKKAERAKLCLVYYCKVHKCCDNKFNLALDANNDPITSLQEYSIFLASRIVLCTINICKTKSTRHNIGSGIGRNKKWLDNSNIKFMDEILD